MHPLPNMKHTVKSYCFFTIFWWQQDHGKNTILLHIGLKMWPEDLIIHHGIRILWSFDIIGALLRTFYDTLVAASLLYVEVESYSSSVLGCQLDSMEEIADRRMLATLTSIMDDHSHPLHYTVESPSSFICGKLSHTRCKKEPYGRSFLPTAIRLFNSNK